MFQGLMERRGEICSHFEAMPFIFKDAPRADGAKRRILDSCFLDSHRDVCLFTLDPGGIQILYAPRADGVRSQIVEPLEGCICYFFKGLQRLIDFTAQRFLLRVRYMIFHFEFYESSRSW